MTQPYHPARLPADRDTSAAVAAYMRSIIRLHELDLQGRDDSPEADEVRDSADWAWPILKRADIERLRWFSQDLFMLGKGEPGEATATVPITAELQNEYGGAKSRSDWVAVLHVLRKLPANYPHASRAFIFGLAWMQVLGPEAALPFLQDAVRLNPGDLQFKIVLMSCLAVIGRPDDVTKVATSIADSHPAIQEVARQFPQPDLQAA